MFGLYSKLQGHDGQPMEMVELMGRASALEKVEWVMVMVYELMVKVEYDLQIFGDLVNVAS